MTLRFYTAEQQVAELENLIRDVRMGKRPTVSMDVVKSIVADIQGRYPEEPGNALGELQRLLADAVGSKTDLGWSIGSLRAIGQFVIGHWPTIRQSLERFESEVTEKT